MVATGPCLLWGLPLAHAYYGGSVPFLRSVEPCACRLGHASRLGHHGSRLPLREATSWSRGAFLQDEDEGGARTEMRATSESQELETLKPAHSDQESTSMQVQCLEEGQLEEEILEGGPFSFDFWLWRGVLLLVTALWGSNFAVIRLIEGGGAGTAVDSSVFAACRFGISSLATLPFLVNISKPALKAGLEVGFFIALGYLGQSLGLETTTANKGAFICALQVVAVVLLNSWAAKKLDVRGGLCASLGVLGVGILELGGASAPSFGDLLCLAQPVFFGLGYVKTDKYANEFKEEALGFSAAQILGVALMSLLWLGSDQFAQGQLPDLISAATSFDWTSISSLLGLDDTGLPLVWACAWTGLITSCLCIVLQTYAFKKVPSSEAAVIIVSEPLWAAVFGNFLLGETIGQNDFIGGGIIALACLVNTLPKVCMLQMKPICLSGARANPLAQHKLITPYTSKETVEEFFPFKF
ncbi:unnamed protein product [Chrysoparadoxa australica]